ncbi:hypothetical protein N2152v2_006561 [Parachlorella kessleri]
MTSPHHQRKPACRVKGCGEELPDKIYYIRHRVCAPHANKPALVLEDGRLVRWCQQCASFQPLSEFEGCRKTCRKQLAAHNRRRRKRPSDEAQAEEAEPPRKAQRPQQGQGRRNSEGSVVEAAGGVSNNLQGKKSQSLKGQDLVQAGPGLLGVDTPPLPAKQGGSPSAAVASSQPGLAKALAAAVATVAAAVAARQRAAQAAAPGEQIKSQAPFTCLPLQQPSWLLDFTSLGQQPPPGPFAAAAGAPTSMDLSMPSWLQPSMPHGGPAAWEAPHAAPAVPAAALLARLLALLVAQRGGNSGSSGHLPTPSMAVKSEQACQEAGQGWSVPSLAAPTAASAGVGSPALRAVLLAALERVLSQAPEPPVDPLRSLLLTLGQVGSSLHSSASLAVPSSIPAYPSYSTAPFEPPCWARSLHDLVPLPPFAGASPYSSLVRPIPSFPQPSLVSWGAAGGPAQHLCPTIAH